MAAAERATQPLAAAESGNAGDTLPAQSPDPTEATFCRREFTLMSVTFGVNHATVTTPIIYASTVLTNAAGQAGNAMLYGATLVCSLFLSTLLFSVLGPKRGLTIAMGLYTVYVVLFAVASSLCSHRNSQGACIQGGSLQLPVVLLGSLVGGFGAGLLWTCQGAFFTAVCERIAAAELRELQAVTAELAGTFAFVFLASECLVRLCSTLLTMYARLSFPTVFFIYSGLALLATLTFAGLARDLRGKESNSRGSTCDKLLSAVKLWRKPQLWLLQSTNLTFGFAAAWLGGYVARNILTKALSSDFIGFAGALLSGLASLLSKLFGPLSARVGKGPLVLLGSLSFATLAVLSKWVGNPAAWGWGTLVFYVLMGIGRAVYESTNKAIFADFFPGEQSPGAFANVFVFGTGASCAAFVLGAAEQDPAELYLLLVFAVLTFPGYLLASLLKGQGAGAARDVALRH